MDLSHLPSSFFLSAIALYGLLACSHGSIGGKAGGCLWGRCWLPCSWYHGDGLYNDYEEYRTIMGMMLLSAAGGRFYCLCDLFISGVTSSRGDNRDF